MATTEHNGLLIYKDASGNNRVLYPITKSELIEGLEELLDTHFDRMDNPHGVTAAQAGAAPASHGHAAADITSGVLPVARGGTGVASIAELAALLPCAMIETGSYTGTETYGESNPNSITFSFAPKAVIFAQIEHIGLYTEGFNTANGANTIILMDLLTQTYQKGNGPRYSGASGYQSFVKKSADGKTLSWYGTENASKQFNSSADKYHYFAIG